MFQTQGSAQPIREPDPLVMDMLSGPWNHCLMPYRPWGGLTSNCLRGGRPGWAATVSWPFSRVEHLALLASIFGDVMGLQSGGSKEHGRKRPDFQTIGVLQPINM